jgi:hypothetical protein
MRFRFVLRGFGYTVFAAVIAAGVASAQTTDFTLVATANGQSFLFTNGSTLPFSAAVGTTQQITVQATYGGSTQATITQPIQKVGSTQFAVTSNLTTPPQVLSPGESFTLTITFTPTNANGASGVLTIPYTEPTGTAGAAVQNSIVIGLSGTSPAYTLSYILQSTKNGAVIPPGGTIPFGATQINTPALADLIITDTGSGAGGVIGITTPPAGSPFQVQDIPPLGPTAPYGLEAFGANNLELLVQYTPTAVENDTSQITITYLGGVTATVIFTGNGIASTFSYTVLIAGTPATTVTPNGTITFPGANVGSTSSLILTITNTGSASGTISSVSTSGPFTLTSPVTLPVTLTVGNKFSVPLTFTPTQVGTQTGFLVVGNATFTLSGLGLGPNLTYAYSSSAGTFTVNPATGGAVLFSIVAVGQSEAVTFTITNSGSLPATISLIGIANGPFTVPALPAQTLAPGKMLSFPITFTPTVAGLSNGVLMVNTTPIPLDGNATAPVPLPAYTISGPSGTAQPATQSNIKLTLSKAYSLDLTGVLTITTEGSFGSDPAVQFAIGSTTGNRTVDFTIPAGTTSADFAGQGSEVLLQTGTVAETVTLTPTFETAGGEAVTPASTKLEFTIPSEAPVLETAQVANETSNSFDLVLTGYSTTRSLSSMSVTFTPATGFNIGTSQLTVDLSLGSTAWFSSSASISFGGLFQITTPFILQGTVPKGDTLIESIGSVTATVSNGTGTSNSLPAPVQ